MFGICLKLFENGVESLVDSWIGHMTTAPGCPVNHHHKAIGLDPGWEWGRNRHFYNFKDKNFLLIRILLQYINA